MCGHRERRVDLGDRLDREAQGRYVGAGAPVLLGHEQSEDSELANLIEQCVVDRRTEATLERARRDLGPAELAYGLPPLPLLIGQTPGNVVAVVVVRNDGRLGG
jgi:hypothetical protein